jgi:putative MFS transporter
MVGSTIPLDEVLNKIDVGWFHVRLWWTTGLGFSAAAAEVVLMSFVFPELRNGPWQLNEYELGFLCTFLSLGSIFGETFFGYISDRYGRRPIFMLTVMIVVVFGILSAFAPNKYWLGVLRLCVGVGYGGNIAVDLSMFSEFVPTERRGTMLFAMAFFWPLGQCFTCLCAWVVIPPYGWQVFVAVCTLPSLLTCFARPLIPESPRYLATQGRGEEAAEVCRQMARQNGLSPDAVGLYDGVSVVTGNEGRGLVSELGGDSDVRESAQGLFGPKLGSTTLGLLLIVGALNYCGYGVLTLMPSFLEMKGIPKSDMYFSMMMNTVAQFPGIVVAAAFAVGFGRLHTIRGSMFVVGIALFGFAFVNSSEAVLACTMVASSALEVGWALYHVYVPEYYPTELRAFATGVLSAGGSIMSMAAPLVSAGFLQAENPFKAILVFAASAIFAGVSSFFLLHVETKDRDLEDVSIAHPVKAM